MASLFDFSQVISKRNKEKKYAEALKYFKENKSTFTPEKIGENKFVVYEIIAALIELNHYDAVFIFIEQNKVILDPKNFSFLLKKVKDKVTPNWIFANKFCDLVSVDSLDTECRTIEVDRKGEKKPMEMASNKEEWYAVKTKALFETKHYEECFSLSKEALHALEVFHYSNDVWFARRIALSKKNLGNSEEAIKELQQVLRRKKEWFIQKELAELFKEGGNHDNAFKLAIDAINNFGDLEYKVDLLYLIGELLKTKGQDDLAFKHFSLSRLIRINEEWNIPSKLTSALTQFGKENITIEKFQELKNELKKYWNSFRPQQPNASQQGRSGNQVLLGKIDKIINDNEKGKAGFIKTSDGKRFYFAVMPNDEITSKIVIGLQVEFKAKAVEGKNDKAVQIKTK